MTVSYAGEVPNGSNFGCFWKILWKWRGSVYKLVWRELIAYLCLYYAINFTYRFALNEEQQKTFNQIRLYFERYGENVPLSFVLGFYVSLVVKRWWEQYRLLPWPDTLALFISAGIPNSAGGNVSKNETGRLMRRNIMRYMVLAYVITLQRISLRVKRRFPTTQHLVDAGLMHESEMKIFEALNQKSPMSKYWMPLVWATNIINRARRDGLITSDHIVQTILVELSDIRRRLGALIGYDTVCLPLVYTQVVTLALYSYFLAALVGRQMLPHVKDHNDRLLQDLYFPFFTVLQFLFYVGWLKVAEVLINPFGEDDDDIELNWLIDRHIKAAYMIVDEMHEEHPELLRDQYWECVVPKELPYTVASEHYRRDEPKGSAENYKVKKEDAMYANIMPGGGKRPLTDDVYADYESVDTPVERRKNNWLIRQFSRMGSMRSQSTAYSSGGLPFNRNRMNSVYSSPEAGLPLPVLQQQQQQQQHQLQQQQHLQVPLQQQLAQQQQQQQAQSKPSLYDKIMHRKSIRAQRQQSKQGTKQNGTSLNVPRTRPRIPTPEVSKEAANERDPGVTNAVLVSTPFTASTDTGTGTNNMPSYMHNQLNQDNLPVFGTLLLTPITEMETTSANNTLIAGHPSTTALAQAVLPMKDAGTANVMPATSNITTLSFPFPVTTRTAGETLPTLSIVPITATGGNLPTITTTSSDNIMQTISVPLSIPRSPSTLSIVELTSPGSDSTDGGSGAPTRTALLAVQSVNGRLTRENSFNANLSLNMAPDRFMLNNRASLRSVSTDEAPDGDHSNRAAEGPSNVLATSAPSTLAKRKTGESKTGEVYV